ncbi:sugar kinase [bacterium E08(2017)]|nr:sugar kinase [bacterium E08(2017)]
MQLVIVGSIGIDTIETPTAKREDILGGSVSYACAASSFFTNVGMVGVVGDDFPAEYTELYENFGIDLQGLQKVPGETFRWSGVYEENMNNRTTISTELNVFETFSPDVPEGYRDTPYLLLGNITPALQLKVLDQMNGLKFVVADTMDLWINIARDELLEVISKVDMLALNDSEARLLTGEYNLSKCAEAIRDMGPKYVIVKKGEHGAMLLSEDGVFIVPAYPCENVCDPTGAGDSFAGGFMGYIAEQGNVDDETVRHALVNGSVVASIGVEGFSLDNLAATDREAIDARLAEFLEMIRV